MLDGVVYGLEGAAGRAYGIHPRVRDGGPGTCNAWRGPHRTPGTFLVTLRSGASRYEYVTVRGLGRHAAAANVGVPSVNMVLDSRLYESQNKSTLKYFATRDTCNDL